MLLGAGDSEEEDVEVRANGGEKKQKVDVGILWDIYAYPNVTEVTKILSGPLWVEFFARPAGQGKNTPIACFATEDKLLEVDFLPKVLNCYNFEFVFALYLVNFFFFVSGSKSGSTKASSDY